MNQVNHKLLFFFSRNCIWLGSETRVRLTNTCPFELYTVKGNYMKVCDSVSGVLNLGLYTLQSFAKFSLTIVFFERDSQKSPYLPKV